MIRTWIRLFGLVALVLSLVLVARPAAAACTATAGTWDDQSACIVYSGDGWVHLGGLSTSIYFAGTTSYSTEEDDTAGITFQANNYIKYCGHKGPQRGYVSFGWVYSGGVENLGSYNYYASSFQTQATCQTFYITSGTLYVANLNTGGQHIDVDYFVVN